MIVLASINQKYLGNWFTLRQQKVEPHAKNQQLIHGMIQTEIIEVIPNKLNHAMAEESNERYMYKVV